MSKQPIIAIYQDGMKYSVEIDGKKIERLKSFAVRVDANPRSGINEYPYCEIEQYLPYPIRKTAKADSGLSGQQAAEQQEETQKLPDRISS